MAEEIRLQTEYIRKTSDAGKIKSDIGSMYPEELEGFLKDKGAWNGFSDSS